MVVQNGPKQKLPNGLFVLNKRADGKGGGMPLLDKVQKKSAFFLRSSLSCQGTTWLPADSLAVSEQLGRQTTAWLSDNSLAVSGEACSTIFSSIWSLYILCLHVVLRFDAVCSSCFTLVASAWLSMLCAENIQATARQ